MSEEKMESQVEEITEEMIEEIIEDIEEMYEDMENIEEHLDELFETVEDLLQRKRYADLRDLLLELEPQDIAYLFDQLDPNRLTIVYRLLPKEQAAEVFVELDSDKQEMLIQSFSNAELKEVLDELYLDDTVDIIDGLFEGYSGTVQVVSEDMKTATVLVRRGRRDMPVELECSMLRLAAKKE